MSLIHLVILSPLLVAVLVPFLHKYFKKIHTGWFVLVLPLVLFIYFLQYLGTTMSGETYTSSMKWIPSIGIDFTIYVDGLGLLFALLITGIGALVVLYSIYYLSKEKEALNTFYVYLLMFMGAMLGVVLSDNLIVMYSFWELTSISSFLLISYWYHREKSRYGALKSMLITVFGGLAMLAGIILLYIMTGSFSIREIIANVDVVTSHELFVPALLLFLLGAFTKSAQFPFHIWLPDAMEAPTPVSAYLHSATMVKAGIYLVARMSPVFAGAPEWFWLVSGFGIVTLFWGSFTAVKQTDLKSILAFSTVSQLGLIMSLLGVGSAAAYYDYIGENAYTIATLAAVFHLINHATFKGSLFMVVGIVDHETGTRDIRKLGGLMNVMPITFSLALIGTFSMAGLPPFNGFLSKEMFFTGMLKAIDISAWNMDTFGIIFPVLAWVASVFTFIYSMVLLFKTFTGKLQVEKLDKEPHEAPIGMLIPPIILASLVVIFGFFPMLLKGVIEPALYSILPSNVLSVEVKIYHWHGFNTELFMTLGVVLFGVLLYLSVAKWGKIYEWFPQKLTLNKLYDGGLIGLERGSAAFTKSHMTGFIRDYLVMIFGFMVVLLGVLLFSTGAFETNLTNVAPVGLYEVILALVMVAAALTTLITKSRLTAIISLGVVGYAMSLFFVLFRAPDLALTQLIVETVSVALFLLCFYHLPEIAKEMNRLRFRLTNFIISVSVGLVVIFIGLSVNSSRLFESISDYFEEASYAEAGGKNMVNVILVDFRGLDTLFEIAVLTIAAFGIFAMIKLRLNDKKGGVKGES
ncbi:Na(+)/H(+) antiporter subunit A [Bacillus sp. THAF10]|uniref:Na+/H+ antiporter subunit A n=1 Tax=Bacillus sp. THAF10 TaxID=2587848 RepID=UPI001267FE3E|nr:Na+/H+ antiporter subunit A [Bacillus sp. THAF10]QFT90376.1 Na(+)/H(+) antiporter subunit A [Bacillus sp. THAF10]